MKQKIIRELAKTYRDEKETNEIIEKIANECRHLLFEISTHRKKSLNNLSIAASELQKALEYEVKLKIVRENIEFYENLLADEEADINDPEMDMDCLTYELFSTNLTKTNMNEKNTYIQEIRQIPGFHKKVLNKLPVYTMKDIYGQEFTTPLGNRFKKEISTAFILNCYGGQYYLVCPEGRSYARYIADISRILEDNKKTLKG